MASGTAAAIDRDAALKRAEKLLRQGRLDGAIEEYARLVEAHPRDWNAINALGDLYVRAGDADRAAAQFVRIADYLFAEGYLPKAAMLYRKTLKVQGGHERALLLLSEIAAQEGQTDEAKQYLRTLASRREAAGDPQGVSDCLIRLGALDPDDGEAKLAAAHAAAALDEPQQAAAFFREAADALTRDGRATEALDALVEAARLTPDDPALCAEVARGCLATGQFDRARLFLTAELAGDDPDLLLGLARLELEDGKLVEGRSLLMRLMMVSTEGPSRALALADVLLDAHLADAAFQCSDVVVEAALLDGEWSQAVEALQALTDREAHVPALIKLVEVCVDGGLDEPMRAAQAQLADAYLASGRGAEARVIAEDLAAWDPSSEANLTRLRRALALAGVEDVEQAVADRLSADALFGVDGPLDLSEEMASEARQPVDVSVAVPRRAAAPSRTPAARAVPEPARSSEGTADSLEVDLSGMLAELQGDASADVPPDDAAPVGSEDGDLESVFATMRARVASVPGESRAADQYDRALRYLERGRVEEAIVDLQVAFRQPTLRFRAAERLGSVHARRGDLRTAVEWFERAAEAPAPSGDEGSALLYELADALEQLGEHRRALAVFMELESVASGYLDVQERIAQLGAAQAGGQGG
ncbi:MAG: tetratricopeptide repeat protein [Vicinamibacterales bacterium]